jgi:hypothetical protein
MREERNELIRVMKGRGKPGCHPMYSSDGTTTPFLIMPQSKRERERMKVEKKRSDKHI